MLIQPCMNGLPVRTHSVSLNYITLCMLLLINPQRMRRGSVVSVYLSV